MGMIEATIDYIQPSKPDTVSNMPIPKVHRKGEKTAQNVRY